MIINTKGDILFQPTDYINKFLEDAGNKTKEQAYSALKILYSFLEIFNLTDSEFNLYNQSQFNNLVAFLNGGIIETYSTKYILKSIRSRKTINYYLSIYRNYF